MANLPLAQQQVLRFVQEGDFAKLKDTFNAFKKSWLELTNARDEYGRTPLHLAVENNRFEFAEALLRYGADPNALDSNKFSPLLAVSQLRRSRITLLLLKYGASNEIRSGSSNASPVYYFLRQYTDPNLALGLITFSQLLDKKDGMRATTSRGETLLHSACLMNGRFARFWSAFLILNGLDYTAVDARGNTCFKFVGADVAIPVSDMTGIPDIATQYSEGDASAIRAARYSSCIEMPQGSESMDIRFELQFDEDTEDKVLRALWNSATLLERNAEINEEIAKAHKIVKKCLSKIEAKGFKKELSNFGVDFMQSLLQKNNIRVPTDVAFLDLMYEGQVMIYDENEQTKNYYCFVLSESIVLVQIAFLKNLFKIAANKQAAVQFVKPIIVYSLTGSSVFNVPDDMGIESSILLRVNQLDGVKRSMILTFPTSQEKDQVLTKLVQITQRLKANVIFGEFLDLESSISPLFEGRLVLRDPTLNKLVHFDAKLVSHGLLLYTTRRSKLELYAFLKTSEMTIEFYPEKRQIQWTAFSNREFDFFALTQAEFANWNAILTGNTIKHIEVAPEVAPDLPIHNAMLEIVIQSGRNLIDMDRGGTSDPYCIVGLCEDNGTHEGLTFQTPPIYATINPTWDRENRFYFMPFLTNRAKSIRIEVWDKNTFLPSTFMGYIILTKDDYLPIERTSSNWFPLKARNPREKTRGDLSISTTLSLNLWNKIGGNVTVLEKGSERYDQMTDTLRNERLVMIQNVATKSFLHFTDKGTIDVSSFDELDSSNTFMVLRQPGKLRTKFRVFKNCFAHLTVTSENVALGFSYMNSSQLQIEKKDDALKLIYIKSGFSNHYLGCDAQTLLPTIETTKRYETTIWRVVPLS
eukprot:TRINITY_DN9253_c0_g1_i1.p1 TRINITY_DN9253_c0_g1~~TRINITY_DN9253_c0_g1_i1.p1  ORF type:complete len:867 (+),score=375.86 TRINITY_DN9253_c0_g1_i1:15-2615(+)